MIYDPKLIKIFRQCRERKKRPDKMRMLICAAMFGPPALIAMGCFIRMVVVFMSGIAILVAGGVQVYLDIPCFILSVITTLFVTGQTILDSKKLMKVASGFYPLAAVAYAISFWCALPFHSGVVVDIPGVLILWGQFVMVISCVLSTLLSIVYRRLYAENEALKPLKGYPHFDPVFMREEELHEEDAPDRTPPEDLTPDERLVWERDRNL